MSKIKKVYKRGDKIVEFKKNLEKRAEKRQREELDKRMELLRNGDSEYAQELFKQKFNHHKNAIEDIKRSVLDTFGIDISDEKKQE